jgi:hypothetical protein
MGSLPNSRVARVVCRTPEISEDHESAGGEDSAIGCSEAARRNEETFRCASLAIMRNTRYRSRAMLCDFGDRRGGALEALHGAHHARDDPDNWAAMTCGVERFEGFQDAWA